MAVVCPTGEVGLIEQTCSRAFALLAPQSGSRHIEATAGRGTLLPTAQHPASFEDMPKVQISFDNSALIHTAR